MRICPGEYLGNGVFEVCDKGLMRDGPWGSNCSCPVCDGTGFVEEDYYDPSIDYEKRVHKESGKCLAAFSVKYKTKLS